MQPNDNTYVCGHCDTLVAIPDLLPGHSAACPLCEEVVVTYEPRQINYLCAFASTALVFLIMACAFDFIEFSTQGQSRSITLVGSILTLVTQDALALAIVVFSLIISIPALFLCGILYVVTAIILNKPWPGLIFVLRWVFLLQPWSMADIFLIGILVSFIKIFALAQVTLGLSFFAYMLFTVSVAVIMFTIDRRTLWQHTLQITDKSLVTMDSPL